MLRPVDTNIQIKPRYRDRGAPIPASPRTLKVRRNKLLKQKQQLIDEPDGDPAKGFLPLVDEQLGLLDEYRNEFQAHEAFCLSGMIDYALRVRPETSGRIAEFSEHEAD
jgi:hypothetical protein